MDPKTTGNDLNAPLKMEVLGGSPDKDFNESSEASSLSSGDSANFGNNFGSLLNEISDAILILDEQSKVEFANRSYLKLVESLGLKITDLLERSIWEVFPDLVQEEVYDRSQRARDTYKAESIEFYYDPIGRWLETRMVPTGKRLVCYIRDISEQKSAILALEQSARRESLISNVLAILLKSKHPSEVIPEIFPQFIAFFGLSSFAYYLYPTEGEKVLTLQALEGIPSDAGDEFLQLWSVKNAVLSFQSERHPQPVRYPEDLTLEDFHDWSNQNQLSQFFLFPLKIEDTLLGVLLVGANDSRNWKSQELDLIELIVKHASVTIDRLRSNQQLYQSEKLFRTIGDTLGYGSWVCDANGKTLYISQCFLDVLGAPEFTHGSMDWSLYIHPDDHPLIQASWQEANRRQFDHWEYETRMKTKERKWVNVLSRGMPLKNENGHVTHWAGINLDVTKYRDAEKKLEIQARTLQLLNEMAESLVESSEVEEISSHIAKFALKLCGAEYATVFYRRRDEAGGKQVYFAYSGYSISQFGEFIPPEFDDLFNDQFIQGGVILQDEYLINDAVLPGIHSKIQTISKDLRSYLAAPMTTPSGVLVGGVFLGHSEPSIFTEETAKLLENILDQGGVVIEKVLLYQDQQRTAEHLSLAVSIANLGEVYWDSESDLMTLSPKAREIFALPTDQTITRTQLRSFIIPADRDRAKACLERSIQTKTPYEVEYRITRADGAKCWIATKGRPVYNENGKLLGMNGVIQDITPQKQVEEALRDARQRLEATLYSAEIGTWTWDIQNKEFVMDKNMARMFSKFSPNPSAAPIEHFVEAVIPEDKERVELALQHALNSRQQDFEIDFRVPGDRGSVRWLTARGRITRNAEGLAKQFPGAIIDITARRSAEMALKEAKETAEKANIAKDRFLAVLSHELRTPLTPVLMTVEELAQRPELDEEVRDAVGLIRRNIELEARLIDDLLDLSLIVSGKLNLYFEKTNLLKLVNEVIEICKAQIETKQLQVEIISSDDADFTLTADIPRLHQILWNLLKNAIKFSPDKSALRFILSTQSDDTLSVKLVDHGMGIDEKVLPRIFAAFEQGDDKVGQKFGGLGLGLAITKALVRLHRGQITAHSDGIGKGAMFEVILPQDQEENAAMSIANAAPGKSKRGCDLHILLVEDHVDTGTILSKLLNRFGYQVSLARSFEEALKLALEKKFDLMISDIGLPDSTGYELMKHIKAAHQLPGIAISGYGMKEDIEKSLAAGFGKHLVKPILVQDIEDAISELLPERVSSS